MKSFRMGFIIAAGAYLGWNVAQGLDRGFGKAFAELKKKMNEDGDES